MERTLVLLDQFDAVLELSDISGGLLVRHLDRGLRLIAVARGDFCLDLPESLVPLRRRLRSVYVPALDARETVQVLQRRLCLPPVVRQDNFGGGPDSRHRPAPPKGGPARTPARPWTCSTPCWPGLTGPARSWSVRTTCGTCCRTRKDLLCSFTTMYM